MASIESDAIEFGPSPLKKQKNEIDDKPRTDGNKDAEMNGEEDAEMNGDEDFEIDGDKNDDSDGTKDGEIDGEEDSENDEVSDSEVDSVIDFEGDAHGKTRMDYQGYESESEERKRQLVLFHYQWEKSEGFEIEWSRFTYVFFALPVVWKAVMCATKERSDKLVKKLTLYAIDKHNQDWGKKLELVKILKANYHMANGHVLYITFCAKDVSLSNPVCLTYQTKVWKCREYIEVEIFRLRPTREEIASVEVVLPHPVQFPGYAEPADLYLATTKFGSM